MGTGIRTVVLRSVIEWIKPIVVTMLLYSAIKYLVTVAPPPRRPSDHQLFVPSLKKYCIDRRGNQSEYYYRAIKSTNSVSPPKYPRINSIYCLTSVFCINSVYYGPPRQARTVFVSLSFLTSVLLRNPSGVQPQPKQAQRVPDLLSSD